MSFTPLGPTIGSIAPPLPVADGGTGAASAAAGLTALGGLTLQASTGATGYTLINGTGNIITWTAPNDGAMHRVLLVGTIRVTVAETGGVISIAFNTPDGAAHSLPVPNGSGGSAVGTSSVNNSYAVQPGQAVTIEQTSALTVGAAILWCELWAL